MRRSATTTGHPPLNVHFIFEGEEESGGHVIYDLLKREPERTKADVVLVCDMSYYASGYPAVYTALRGMCYAEISVRTLRRDLHSGTYGGVAPNAVETLVHLLHDLKSERRADPHPQALQIGEAAFKAGAEDLEAAPVQEEAVPAGGGDRQGTDRLEEVLGVRAHLGASHLRNSRHQGWIRRRWSKDGDSRPGDREGESPAGPGLSFDAVQKWLTRAAQRAAPSYAEVQVKILHGGDPVQVDVNDPAFAALDEAFKEEHRA